MPSEVHYPWMDWPDVPDPDEIKQCGVTRMRGVKLKDYKDYGPFRRCGCKLCVNVVRKYDAKA